MTETATNPRLYYVGLNGEQKGPYSEDALTQMLQRAEISPDDLVWYEGLSDWKPIKEFPELIKSKETAVAEPNPPPGERRDQSSPLSTQFDTGAQTRIGQPVPEPPAYEPNFETESDFLEPVFNEGRANLSDSGFAKQRTLFVSLGVLGFLAVGAMGYLWWAESTNAEAKKKFVPPKQSAEATRQIEYSQAVSAMATDPEGAILRLKEISKANPKDTIGKEALEFVVDYYRRQQRHLEAGNVFMEAKRPAEAIKFFMEDPATIAQAENAMGLAGDSSQGKEKREFLINQIKLLLGPVSNPEKAIERIKLLEKSFPGEPHPYTYYLKTTDQRIADIFSRTSFHFVSALYSYLSTELPQINLVDRPLVEVKKSPKGEYRIIASYKGEVLLNHDRLKNIYFIFWLAADQWALVDTNLTKERTQFGAKEREKHKGAVLSDIEMLSFLETIFKQQFPKHALHELVTPESKKIDTNAD